VKPLVCKHCDDVRALAARALSGSTEGGTVQLYWGAVVPQTNVQAQILVPCRPMMSFAEWKDRLSRSEEFCDAVNRVAIPLREGASVSRHRQDPQESRWLQFEYRLARVKY